MLCERDGRQAARRCPSTTRGELLLDEYEKLLSPRTQLVAVGPRLQRAGHDQPGPARSSRWPTRAARLVLIDGAQAAPHLPVDVQALDCDFYAFSGHKVFGPTGIGVLYGKTQLLEAMPPYQGGGDMIHSVTFEKTTYNDLPNKFEAGTPQHRRRHRPGRGDRLSCQHRPATRIAAHEHELLVYATSALSADSRRAHHRHRARTRPPCSRS